MPKVLSANILKAMAILFMNSEVRINIDALSDWESVNVLEKALSTRLSDFKSPERKECNEIYNSDLMIFLPRGTSFYMVFREPVRKATLDIIGDSFFARGAINNIFEKMPAVEIVPLNPEIAQEKLMLYEQKYFDEVKKFLVNTDKQVNNEAQYAITNELLRTVGLENSVISKTKGFASEHPLPAVWDSQTHVDYYDMMVAFGAEVIADYLYDTSVATRAEKIPLQKVKNKVITCLDERLKAWNERPYKIIDIKNCDSETLYFMSKIDPFGEETKRQVEQHLHVLEQQEKKREKQNQKDLKKRRKEQQKLEEQQHKLEKQQQKEMKQQDKMARRKSAPNAQISGQIGFHELENISNGNVAVRPTSIPNTNPQPPQALTKQ